jgi:hypothetical protein
MITSTNPQQASPQAQNGLRVRLGRDSNRFFRPIARVFPNKCEAGHTTQVIFLTEAQTVGDPGCASAALNRAIVGGGIYRKDRLKDG